MVHKLDALLWALGLETNTGIGSRQDCIRNYADRVVCNLSDQGANVFVVD